MRCFKLYHFYSIDLICQALGNFSGVDSEILYLRLEKETENFSLVFTSLIKQVIRKFHLVVVQCRQINVQKKRDARAKLLFCQSKTSAYLPFSLPSLLLKLPNNRIGLREFHRQRRVRVRNAHAWEVPMYTIVLVVVGSLGFD